ncbi:MULTISPECIES: general secretion pathway protein GspN [Stenotrophomonas]|jgi:general secretion pathway protein N|uniref:general secretion pathway protein GspN n=1 Tax=Stenotrophomonas TaxID=40323 RepID=UPI0012919D1E|nr:MULTISPECIES: general secretion pathway protein GspN [Stenotrophomonas]MBD3825385.1 general secretion pathway protein GspN [Stenotrophomonas sp.]
MKIDVAPLRTWWLAAVLAWAAAIWLATLFGLGGRLGPAPPPGRAAAALPVLPPAAPERMATAASYADIGTRPLFAEDRTPRPYLLGGSEPGAASTVSLTGVLLTDSFAMAILTTDQHQSLRLRLNGDAVNGWQLLALEPRRATVAGPGGTQVLELPVFNGQGGEPPTVLGNPTPGGGVPPAGQPMPALPPPASAAAQARPTNGPSPAAVARPVAPAPAPAPAQNEGPSEEQMSAIRERIQARRQQLQQQQQQQQSSQRPPAGGSGQNP